MSKEPSIPIACELPLKEQERCAEVYRNGLFSHVEEVVEKDDGYSLRFSWSKERVLELGEFLALDSSCCPFLAHSLEIPPGKSVVWLHLDGPSEAHALLQQELQQILPAHCK